MKLSVYIKQCCQCKIIMDVCVLDGDEDLVSHGYCSRCFEKIKKQLVCPWTILKIKWSPYYSSWRFLLMGNFEKHKFIWIILIVLIVSQAILFTLYFSKLSCGPKNKAKCSYSKMTKMPAKAECCLSKSNQK